jgi:hypothetical protein
MEEIITPLIGKLPWTSYGYENMILKREESFKKILSILQEKGDQPEEEIFLQDMIEKNREFLNSKIVDRLYPFDKILNF